VVALLPSPKLTPKQRHERERQGYNWRGVGLIEYEFGGKGEAEWRKSSLSGMPGVPYKPTCLDEILRGGFGEVKMLPSFLGGPPITIDTRTNIRRLQELFGMHRNRFYRYLRDSKNARSGRERLYSYLAILKLMQGLLTEESQEHKGARGAPRRIWLSDPDLRAGVLSGIAVRINSLSVPEEIKPRIKAKFLALVHSYLPDSAKK
jgi:hypothetical protein